MTSAPKKVDDRSFAEILVTDAFSPGVRPQSFDAVNYALVGLLLVGLVSIYLLNGSIHLTVLLILGAGLGIVMNK
jgi:hypothetical protein